MEADEKMILKDMPVDTRNYSIIDNVTGKPIDQDNYTLTIDPEVISKLNQLKKMNEEKIKQAALKDEYQGSSYVNTFTGISLNTNSLSLVGSNMTVNATASNAMIITFYGLTQSNNELMMENAIVNTNVQNVTRFIGLIDNLNGFAEIKNLELLGEIIAEESGFGLFGEIGENSAVTL